MTAPATTTDKYNDFKKKKNIIIINPHNHILTQKTKTEICTFRAPASLAICTSSMLVVPLTMLSSTSKTFLPTNSDLQRHVHEGTKYISVGQSEGKDVVSHMKTGMARKGQYLPRSKASRCRTACCMKLTCVRVDPTAGPPGGRYPTSMNTAG